MAKVRTEGRRGMSWSAAEPVRMALADIFARHERVFLAFSGGKDSLALAHLCEPWRNRLTLLWTNTGHMAPYMVEFVRGHRDRYELIELAPERPMFEQWRDFGTPADIMPLEHLAGVDWRTPRLQPWTACCGVHRVQPIVTYLGRRAEPCALLLGQRQRDMGGTVAGLSAVLSKHVEVALPLWDWSTADVLAYVAERGTRLQPHHDACPTSIECIICPANLSAEKLQLLDRIEPEAATFVRDTVRHSLGLATAKANEILSVIEGTGQAEREIRR